MATSQKLVFTFNCEDGKQHNLSYSYAKTTAREADVQALAGSIVTNGSIFENVPVSVHSAKMVVTSETEYDLS